MGTWTKKEINGRKEKIEDINERILLGKLNEVDINKINSSYLQN